MIELETNWNTLQTMIHVSLSQLLWELKWIYHRKLNHFTNNNHKTWFHLEFHPIENYVQLVKWLNSIRTLQKIKLFKFTFGMLKLNKKKLFFLNSIREEFIWFLFLQVETIFWQLDKMIKILWQCMIGKMKELLGILLLVVIKYQMLHGKVIHNTWHVVQNMLNFGKKEKEQWQICLYFQAKRSIQC